MIISSKIYESIKENSVMGRYVTHKQITDYLKGLPLQFTTETIGHSVEQKSIEAITLGSGSTKILMWSQMHGNESTTTKAVLDLINYFQRSEEHANEILRGCTIKIILMLNPDGAEAYKRVNANGIDLNRDAQALTQPESRVLRNCYDEFRPDYCFNLHDQRTIYNVGNTNKPATASFLSPAFNTNRDLSPARMKSMGLIYIMNEELQESIPGQVGRYDDAFNANCVGDTFQMLETPTVLFEAGHYPGDYQRETTRKYICVALLAALNAASGALLEFSPELYTAIPENNKLYFDILIRNAWVIRPELKKNEALGLLFKEVLRDGSIHFEPEIDSVGNLDKYFGHIEYDCADEERLVRLKSESFWKDIISSN